jgi:GTP cyclohydrolase I
MSYDKEDLKKINQEVLVKKQLEFIGEDPEREGLIDTPKRVVKMWKEIFRGYDPKQRPNVSIFKNGTDGITYDQMIIDTGDFYSHCEHHMVPFFGRYWFGYIPDKKGGIIGLSKVARLVDYHAAKLQIQERLVHDIVEDIWNTLSEEHTRPIGMGLVMEGEHLCKTMRGARKKGRMTTIKLKGAFFDNATAKAEFLQKCMQ